MCHELKRVCNDTFEKHKNNHNENEKTLCCSETKYQTRISYMCVSVLLMSVSVY